MSCSCKEKQLGTWVGPYKIYSDKSKSGKRELVGGSNPIWKILVNLDHFPGDGGKTPHLVNSKFSGKVTETQRDHLPVPSIFQSFCRLNS